ncbi:BA75_03918T0 [Komagataella pastoris]|uniref:BA75_03918T0 n=1 Tax=Komagataella pastoris TaxID=4922 RepID=A0A1B2JFY2_PICPA|nr:BA75_03918T0 [Komagataella pastoris]
MLLSRRYLSKAYLSTSADRVSKVKERLAQSQWINTDYCISGYPATQLYWLLESSLFKDTPGRQKLGNVLDPLHYTLKGEGEFEKGNQVPFGYHFLYCNPLSIDKELGLDGYDSYASPTELTTDGTVAGQLFKRRMWVGGSILNSGVPFLVGDEVTLTERVKRVKCLGEDPLSLDFKSIITTKREFRNAHKQPMMVEERKLVFFNDQFHSTIHKNRLDLPISQFQHVFTPSLYSNVKYSSLISNTHKIHYDAQYAQSEGYPDVLISGPFIVNLCLHYFGKVGSDLKIREFQYKNISPMFPGKEYQVCLTKVEDKKYQIWIQSLKGDLVVYFYGTITLEDVGNIAS